MKFNNRNIHISSSAIIGNNVKIGDETVIYDNVIIEDNSMICNNCIIGEPANNYYFENNYSNPKTVIKNNSLIRSHSIIYAGCTLGNNFSTGHNVVIREHSIFGDHCRVGTSTDIQGYVRFGNYCWLHSGIFIAQYSTIKDFVFIYPQVCFANDPHPPSNINKGATVENFAQIGAKSILLAGINIGQHALIGMAAVVVRDVAPYQLVLGNPAKVVKDVREIRSRENDSQHYPWPKNFNRGMPWAETGFEKWLDQNPEYS